MQIRQIRSSINLLILVFYALQCIAQQKFMWYKFMRPVHDLHGSHKQKLGHKIVALRYPIAEICLQVDMIFELSTLNSFCSKNFSMIVMSISYQLIGELLTLS